MWTMLLWGCRTAAFLRVVLADEVDVTANLVAAAVGPEGLDIDEVDAVLDGIALVGTVPPACHVVPLVELLAVLKM